MGARQAWCRMCALMAPNSKSLNTGGRPISPAVYTRRRCMVKPREPHLVIGYGYRVVILARTCFYDIAPLGVYRQARVPRRKSRKLPLERSSSR